MSLQQKVKTLKVSELFRALVESLRNPIYEVDMRTYGSTIDRNGNPVLCGCAALHTMSYLSNVKLTTDNMNSLELRAEAFNCNVELADVLESAIERLRANSPRNYNELIEKLILGQYASEALLISGEVFAEYRTLPILTTSSYQRHLNQYEAFAKLLESVSY